MLTKEPSSKRISFDEFDEIRSPRPGPSAFQSVIDRALTRRSFLGGSIAFSTAAFVLGSTALRPAFAQSRLGFEQVAANTLDTVTVPPGYNWQVVALWGDPLWSGAPAFDETTRGTGASQELAFGDNVDGMHLFYEGGRTILAANNEYTNTIHIHGNRESGTAETPDDVRKSKAAHGVTVVELAEMGGRWGVVTDSPYNRRITADTVMEITGPARGHDLMKTAADPSGTTSLGTMNNCGAGKTPWGTYLTCEENFNGYFSSSNPDNVPTEAMARYGIANSDFGYNWAMGDERFDISLHPNEPNRAGYTVEIDPLDPTSTPKKRTALGRFKHENAAVVIAASGKAVVYSGDDERGEFLYRFVSDREYVTGGDNSNLLESGTLYVARFDDDMRGEWLPLTPETTGMTLAEICIHTRQAATAVGATTMDRPEWVAVNPNKVEAYLALTNNSRRGNEGQPVGGPNPRAANNYGQIVRWEPDGADHAAPGFSWDLFVLAGNPAVHSDEYAGSANVNAGNMFNSPDGIAFDRNGMLWIQTDGNYSNEGDFAGMGNNQMLVGDPATGEIRRFLVGPRECEVTGIDFTADGRTMFVGIQHPGEDGGSHFPAGGGSVPRSAVIAIQRDDGGIIA